MATKLLLIKDVEHLGRSGDVVSVKPGYARNYLIPQRLAMIATEHALKLRDKLQKEREERAAQDKLEAIALSERLSTVVVMKKVKVDPDGHMYGSVSASDIVNMLAEQGFEIEKKSVQLHKAIRTVGDHQVSLKLKEGITCDITLTIECE